MKVLFVGREKKTLSIDAMLDRLRELCDLTVIKLGPEEIKNIKKTLLSISTDEYDCTVLNLPFRRIANKYRSISKLSRLVIFDYDSNRNFLKGDDYYNKYTKFFKKLEGVKLICSGYYNSKRYMELGVDAHFVSKGYDNTILSNLDHERDIDLGFIGRVDDSLYEERKRYLKGIGEEFDLKIFRTNTKDEYVNLLNRIKIFVSADIGYNEYMAKNFEAMACGCMLLAKQQGNGEEEALGLIDMQNVVLYSDLDDAKDKVRYLLQHESLINGIAYQGQDLAERSLGFGKKAEELFFVISS